MTKENLNNIDHILEPGIIHDIRQETSHATLNVAKDKLAFVEAVRETKLRSYLFRKKIGAMLAVILTPICAFIDWLLISADTSPGDDNAAGLTVIMLGILYTWVTKPKKDYAKAYKNKLLPNIIKVLGNFKYNIKGKIPMHLMLPSKIIPRYDRYKSEDHFEGEYKGSKIQFSEIDLLEKRHTRKRTHYASVFKGLAILFEIKNKKIYGHTIIDYNSSKVSEWFKEKSLDLKRANLVDPEFEKTFDVYTNDQVEARYLVDPTIMEKLKDLYKHYHGSKITAAYYEDKFLILIESSRNHFEPPDIYIPASDPQGLKELKKEVEDVLDIGDHLELYDPDQVQKEKSELSKQAHAE